MEILSPKKYTFVNLGVNGVFPTFAIKIMWYFPYYLHNQILKP